MSNGKPISLIDAQKNIRAFVNQEKRRTLKKESSIVVGQKIDLTVLKSFIKAIDDHAHSGEIDAVRIYFGLSNRGKQISKNEYDVVIVPVLKRAYGQDYDLDLHAVYTPPQKELIEPTIIGNSLPCPNVCPPGKKNIGCGPDDVGGVKKKTPTAKKTTNKKRK